jgi:hypothetical protein
MGRRLGDKIKNKCPVENLQTQAMSVVNDRLDAAFWFWQAGLTERTASPNLRSGRFRSSNADRTSRPDAHARPSLRLGVDDPRHFHMPTLTQPSTFGFGIHRFALCEVFN